MCSPLGTVEIHVLKTIDNGLGLNCGSKGHNTEQEINIQSSENHPTG